MTSLRPKIRSARGFSLIEILVAILVLSVGLLGMAALMASSLRNNQSANFRTQATNLAYDYIDMMRANSVNTELYARADFSDPAVCNAAQTAFDFSDYDPSDDDPTLWARSLCYALPNGRGRATVTELDEGSFNAVVEVCWLDDRAENQTQTDDCDGDGETRFVAESRI